MPVSGGVRRQWRIQNRRSGGWALQVYRRSISGDSELIENPLEKGDSGGILIENPLEKEDSGGTLPENFLNVGKYSGF